MSKAQMKKTMEPLSPMKFMNDLWGARTALALIAAIDLDVFTTISQGKKTVAELSRSLKLPRRMLEHLLEALAAMGYLTKRGTQYGLTPVSDTFLVRTKPSYMGAMADETRMTIPQWTQLADVIRNGKPASAVDTEEGRQFFPKLVQAIFPMTYSTAQNFARSFSPTKLKKVSRILDVAAGSGAWSLPFAQANPSVRVTAVDYPEVTAVTREYATRFRCRRPIRLSRGESPPDRFRTAGIRHRDPGPHHSHRRREMGQETCGEILQGAEAGGHAHNRRNDSERLTDRARVSAPVRFDDVDHYRRRRRVHDGSIQTVAQAGRLPDRETVAGRRPFASDPGDTLRCPAIALSESRFVRKVQAFYRSATQPAAGMSSFLPAGVLVLRRRAFAEG